MKASELANLLSGRLLGDDVAIKGVAPLCLAKADHLSFIIWPKDIRLAKKTTSGCILAEIDIAAEYADQIPSSIIVIDNFFNAFSVLKNLSKDGVFLSFNTDSLKDWSIDKSATIDPLARIGKKVFIDKSVSVSAYAVIEDYVVINEGCFIGPGVVIQRGSILGKNCYIGANTVIGSFGFVPYGLNPSKLLPLLGNVVIDDDVRLGALCTIDRGLFSATRIKKNTLIDNMVHVGHDAVIGENVIIAAQSGLAGNVRLEDHVTLGGQVGVKPHVVVGKGARISGKSMVHCDIKPHQIWSGNPSVPHGIYLRAYGALMRNLRKSFRDQK